VSQVPKTGFPRKFSAKAPKAAAIGTNASAVNIGVGEQWFTSVRLLVRLGFQVRLRTYLAIVQGSNHKNTQTMKTTKSIFFLILSLKFCILCSCSPIEKNRMENEFTKETLNVLNKTKMALRAYKVEESKVAGFLRDLNPKYLVLPPNDDYPGVPVDAWGNPIIYSKSSNCLRSAGPDEQFETDDDIVLLITSMGAIPADVTK
jgi:hypothetical protein